MNFFRRVEPGSARGIYWWLFFFVVIVILSGARTALATPSGDAIVGTGTPESCTEADFDTALTKAQSGDGGTITFDCGGEATIKLTSQKTLSGEITIDGGDQITLTGGNSTRLFWVFAATLHLKNITVSNGFSNTGDGGAIRNDGVLTLQNTTIRNSIVSSNFSGGAIVNYGPLTISDSHFENNVGGNGGALYLRFEDGGAEISGSTFRDNRTTNTDSGWGGAILLWGADVTIRSSTFEQNRARDGGALHNQFAGNAIVLEDNTKFSVNSASGNGGAIFNVGSLTATDVALSGNRAYYGGGISNDGTAILTRVTISGNWVNNPNLDGAGGGISNDGTAILTQVTISSNSADDRGGGMANFGRATLTHVTFSDNSASPEGGGIFHSGQDSMTLKNVLLDKGNLGWNCYYYPNLLPISSAGFNLSSDDSCESFTQGGDRQNVNPLLGPLADNGGPTLTHMLLPGSPAIDAGQCVSGLNTDQRGLPRFQGLACDIGAVEIQPDGGSDESLVYLPTISK